MLNVSPIRRNAALSHLVYLYTYLDFLIKISCIFLHVLFLLVNVRLPYNVTLMCAISGVFKLMIGYIKFTFWGF